MSWIPPVGRTGQKLNAFHLGWVDPFCGASIRTENSQKLEQVNIVFLHQITSFTLISFFWDTVGNDHGSIFHHDWLSAENLLDRQHIACMGIKKEGKKYFLLS